MKVEKIWSAGIWGCSRSEMPNKPPEHISEKQGLRRLEHILRAKIPPDKVGALIGIEPTKLQRVGKIIVEQEHWSWRNAIENPDSLGGNMAGISFAWSRYPVLIISVTRTGSRWGEFWAIQDWTDMSAEFPRRGGQKPYKLPPIPLPLGVKQYRGNSLAAQMSMGKQYGQLRYRTFWSI